MNSRYILRLQEDMVCLSCTATGERVCLAAEGFGNRHCFLENIADKVRIVGDLFIYLFFLMLQILYTRSMSFAEYTTGPIAMRLRDRAGPFREGAAGTRHCCWLRNGNVQFANLLHTHMRAHKHACNKCAIYIRRDIAFGRKINLRARTISPMHDRSVLDRMFIL